MNRFAALLLPFSAALLAPLPASAQAGGAMTAPSSLTYADLVDLTDSATVIARAQVRSMSRLRPGQGTQARPGFARVYVEGRTRALLLGGTPSRSIGYLADVPLTASGRLPDLRKRDVLVFGRPVPGRPGQLQLTAADAQLAWSPELENRTRTVVAELNDPAAAPRVLGVREAMHVPGNLIGEGETQIFLGTATGSPISISVLRRPDGTTTWGASLGEIVDVSARPPARETLTWYRLACFLPPVLPAAAILSAGPAERVKAAEDYAFVRRQLGVCRRSRLRG